MISSRAALTGHLRTFFEIELPGLYKWDEVRHYQPEDAPLQSNGRRNMNGKHRELVSIGFGDYEMTVQSPEDKPPLGWVSVQRKTDQRICVGPLDHATWVKMGKFIKGKIDA